MVKDIVKKKLGIKPELSDDVAEGNEDVSVPKQIVTEAGRVTVHVMSRKLTLFHLGK